MIKHIVTNITPKANAAIKEINPPTSINFKFFIIVCAQ